MAYQLAVRCLNTIKFCGFMKEHLNEKYGVKFVQGEIKAVDHTSNVIKSLEYFDEKSQIHTLEGFDKYVMCTGIGSINIGKMIGMKVPLYGFKGHTLNMYVKNRENPDCTYIYIPENICISRVGYQTDGMVRVSGFADLVGLDIEPIPWRKEMLIKLAKTLVNEEDYDESRANHWVGLRPVCSDDVPLIGQSSKFNNLYWNIGHGARGITESAGSATLLAHAISGDKLSDRLDAKDYLPGRFGL